jgi:hypothetical protein
MWIGSFKFVTFIQVSEPEPHRVTAPAPQHCFYGLFVKKKKNNTRPSQLNIVSLLKL